MKEDVLLCFEGNIIPCKTHDLSASGVRLVLAEKIDIPENVVIDMLFKPKSVKAKAKFIRYDDEDDVLKASFKFIGLPESEVDIISQICIQKQLEYKRNSLM